MTERKIIITIDLERFHQGLAEIYGGEDIFALYGAIENGKSSANEIEEHEHLGMQVKVEY